MLFLYQNTELLFFFFFFCSCIVLPCTDIHQNLFNWSLFGWLLSISSLCYFSYLSPKLSTTTFNCFCKYLRPWACTSYVFQQRILLVILLIISERSLTWTSLNWKKRKWLDHRWQNWTTELQERRGQNTQNQMAPDLSPPPLSVCSYVWVFPPLFTGQQAWPQQPSILWGNCLSLPDLDQRCQRRVLAHLGRERHFNTILAISGR